jgi:hypothetical protein
MCVHVHFNFTVELREQFNCVDDESAEDAVIYKLVTLAPAPLRRS